ncbi:uncharacterized protein LOC109594693 [Aethina tumida]|uniref:uncharacterized protein LOC109594693 n=1 Tax=Aethina tumida TaxID=116153 RepID=UPI002148E7F4|nr:uncharacterized protein LOC109594693 [Aethina tumida]
MASSNNVRDDFLLNNVPSCVDGIVSMKPKNCNQYAMRDYAMKVLKTVFSLPSPTLCTFIINTDYTSKLGNLLESSDLNDIQIGAQGLKSHLSLPMGVNYVCSVPGRINFMLTQLNKATKTMLERTSDHIIGIIVACYQKIAADRRSNGYSPEKVHPSILDDTFLEPLKRARARRFRQPRIINQIVHQ